MPFFHIIVVVAALFRVLGLEEERLTVAVEETGEVG